MSLIKGEYGFQKVTEYEYHYIDYTGLKPSRQNAPPSVSPPWTVYLITYWENNVPKNLWYQQNTQIIYDHLFLEYNSCS